MKKILLLDNYDSFTYNLFHIIRELGFNADVFRNDKILPKEVDKYDKIIFSPGPGLPSDSGLMPAIIKKQAPKKSMLGVCLGHQAIAENFGAILHNLDVVYHGVSTPVKVIEADYIFNGLPATFEVGRYHSWIVKNTSFPENLRVTALSNDGHIMAIKHDEYDIHGVQFHPESILTPVGKDMIRNFLTH